MLVDKQKSKEVFPDQVPLEALLRFQIHPHIAKDIFHNGFSLGLLLSAYPSAQSMPMT